MQTNLINSYIQNKTSSAQSPQTRPSDKIELVTKRKAKPHFDINRELANRAYMRPLEPKGHIVHVGPVSSLSEYVSDVAYDLKALKSAWKGEANDHQLGKLNDLGMKLGGLGIASYLFSMKKAPVQKGMEFVGFGAFFASMALWPKIALEFPARLIHGFNPFMKYEDSQGRKKPFFQDNQYLPYDMISDKEINKVGNRTGIPKNMPNRRDAVQEKMRKIALQNNTMWMLTAGFATPVMSSLICYGLENGFSFKILGKKVFDIPPLIPNIYQQWMNSKTDGILKNFPAAQKKFRSNAIEHRVNNFFEFYKGRVVTEEAIDRLSTILTQDLSPTLKDALKADLAGILTGNGYKVSSVQAKNLQESINTTIKKIAGKGYSPEQLKLLFVSDEQINKVLVPYVNEECDVQTIRKISNEIISEVENTLRVGKDKGVPLNKNTYKNIVKAMSGKTGMNGPIMSVLTTCPANSFDEQLEGKIRCAAAKLTDFSAESKALDTYAYKKLASAPDTAKGQFWNDTVKSFVKILGITADEIEQTRFDRLLVAKLLSTKMQKIAADKDTYADAIKSAAKSFSENIQYIQPKTITDLYIAQLETSYNSAADNFRNIGFTKTAEKIAGKNGRLDGSLLGVSKSFAVDNIENVKNTFARFFNALNFYRAAVVSPSLSWANEVYNKNGTIEKPLYPRELPKEIKEEIYAMSNYLATSGRISDYSVKLECLRNLTPNTEDMGNLTFNSDGTIKYGYYNKKKLAKNGVLIPSDVNFFKRVMNTLYSGNILEETKNAIASVSSELEGFVNEYRKNMMEKVGDLEYFANPNAVMHDEFDINSKRRIYSSATPNEKSLCVGSAMDDMFANCTRQMYNTRKWLKMFGGFFAGLLALTVVSQFFFGKGRSTKTKDRV